MHGCRNAHEWVDVIRSSYALSLEQGAYPNHTESRMRQRFCHQVVNCRRAARCRQRAKTQLAFVNLYQTSTAYP